MGREGSIKHPVMEHSAEETKETTAKKTDKKTKDKLFALASAAGGIGVNAVNMLGVRNSFLKSNANNYENINTPKGVKQESAIIEAHKKATGLNNPQVVNSTDLPGLPDRFKYGAYMPRHLVGLQGLGKDLNLPKNEGLLVAGPDVTSFIMAHELGHRAQDYHKIAGPSQMIGNLLPMASGLATTAVSAQAKTNRGALAKGLLTSYALNLPRIASEITATRLGNQYLKSAGIATDPYVSLMQPIGYLLQPAGEALISVAQGRLIRAVKNKLQNRKKQKEEAAQAQASQ